MGLKGPGERERTEKTAVRVIRAVDCSDDRALGKAPLRVLDDQGIDCRAAHHALADCAHSVLRKRAEPPSADHEQVMTPAVGFPEQRPVVFPFEGACCEGNRRCVAGVRRVIQIRVGDQGEPAGDELVVNLALLLERRLLTVLRWQPPFHLAKAQVVQPGGVDVDPGHLRARDSRQRDRLVHAPIGVIGAIRRHQDRAMQRMARRFGVRSRVRRVAAVHDPPDYSPVRVRPAESVPAPAGFRDESQVQRIEDLLGEVTALKWMAEVNASFNSHAAFTAG